MNNVKLLLTGFADVDFDHATGGIDFVLPGYLEALDKASIPYSVVYTYENSTFTGKFVPWLRGSFKVVNLVKSNASKNRKTITYSHAGADVSLFREACLLYVAKMMGSQTIMHIHAAQIESYVNHNIKKKLFSLLLKPIDTVIVLTPWWQNLLTDSSVHPNIKVIPNPLPNSWRLLATKEVVHSNNSQLTLLIVTRIEKGKGVGAVIHTMTYLPDDIKLVIAGDGEMLENFVDLVETLQLEDRVSFKGWVSGKKKQQLIEQADIFCQPTTFDAMPMTFLEMMANGLPIVAIAWGGIVDIMPDGEAGILVADKKPELLAEAVMQMKDSGTRYKMGKAGKEWVLKNYSSDVVSRQIRRILPV